MRNEDAFWLMISSIEYAEVRYHMKNPTVLKPMSAFWLYDITSNSQDKLEWK